jgi:hypothetical protein
MKGFIESLWILLQILGAFVGYMLGAGVLVIMIGLPFALGMSVLMLIILEFFGIAR